MLDCGTPAAAAHALLRGRTSITALLGTVTGFMRLDSSAATAPSATLPAEIPCAVLHLCSAESHIDTPQQAAQESQLKTFNKAVCQDWKSAIWAVYRPWPTSEGS